MSVSEPLWRPSLPWLWTVFAFDQSLAIPIALLSFGNGMSWQSAIIGASVYTHAIGSLCFLGGALLQGRCESLSGWRRHTLSLLTNTFLAIIGGTLAAVILQTVFGYHMTRESILLKTATGASVAALVAIGKMTSNELRIALEISEQSLRERELAQERLLKAKSEAELAALQARINPHFLFNTLNSIAALIGDDPEKAEQLLGQLSSLMRYALQSHRAGVVSVEDELTIVRGYLEIEHVRLGTRLHYEIDVDPALYHTELPVLLLQPLVENAIKHGIAPKVAGGRVLVRGWRDAQANATIFTITDDGDGAGDGHRHVRARDTTGTGEGLTNVRQRLEALYGARASVTLTRQNGITETRVELPLAASTGTATGPAQA